MSTENTETVRLRTPGPHAPLPTAPAKPQIAVPADPVQEDSPAARAARRAAELLGALDGLDDGTDEYHIPPEDIPDGWSYEWKRHTTLGAEDPSYQVQIARGGWQAVPASRHPTYMPTGYEGATIMRKGMILMERPLVITEKRIQMEKQQARAQVKDKEAQLTGAPVGAFPGDNKGTPVAKFNKSYEGVAIPK